MTYTLDQVQYGSPFLDPGSTACSGSLAMLHLRRDQSLPTKLSDRDDDNEGYDEGRVTNTRFGSFPHSTLIGLPWGSQVRASKVDTGSRGRRGLQGRDGVAKRKRAEDTPPAGPSGESPSTETPPPPKSPIVASTGFVHLLPPTPESWTMSLPHRTQVVYTPDYSYVLHRLRARPGSIVIEAGAGSGSFTHAAARAVYKDSQVSEAVAGGHAIEASTKVGKVYSYEFHEQRVDKLQTEISEHRLDDVVQITHRDVCRDGFLLKTPNGSRSPEADAIFLDVPAPWLALPHLTRLPWMKDLTDQESVIDPLQNTLEESAAILATDPQLESDPPCGPVMNGTAAFISPLNAKRAVRICTFSPCIEQVQRTIATLRQYGWVDIEMVEIAHKRLEVRREHASLEDRSQRGIQAMAGTVEESVKRLKEVEGSFKKFHAERGPEAPFSHENGPHRENYKEPSTRPNRGGKSKETILKSIIEHKLYKTGTLIHRPEPELKTHTSYLVFALLPRTWTSEHEEEARQKWLTSSKFQKAGLSNHNQSRRQLKRTARAAYEQRHAEAAATTPIR
ncbi:MAG: tRNA (adenine-N(1)-)-methyltransferase catalytic subunit trm61 [Caeruleum heppii]|nr:MAG: tRNA (adenine-N(1)-)-methyltransferase catalytic subunit trm61 [Caeruleum heppii]